MERLSPNTTLAVATSTLLEQANEQVKRESVCTRISVAAFKMLFNWLNQPNK